MNGTEPGPKFSGRDRDQDSDNFSGRDGTGIQIFGTGRDRDPDSENASGRDGTGTEIFENQRDGTGPGPKFEKRPGRDGTGPRPVPSLVVSQVYTGLVIRPIRKQFSDGQFLKDFELDRQNRPISIINVI